MASSAATLGISSWQSVDTVANSKDGGLEDEYLAKLKHPNINLGVLYLVHKANKKSKVPFLHFPPAPFLSDHGMISNKCFLSCYIICVCDGPVSSVQKINQDSTKICNSELCIKL